MEQNQFEGLEGLEALPVQQELSKGLKEYEKLLIAEANRAKYEKAVNLVNYGCFEQKQEPVVDFTKLSVVVKNKKFKKSYTLYENNENGDLLFVYPLLENNKGDVDEDKNMAPYAYDVLYVETMNEETYKAVTHAAKNNLGSKIKALYISTFVVFYVMIALVLFNLIYALIQSASNGFWYAFASALYSTAPYIAGTAIMLPLLVLISIKYKSYKDQE